MKIEPIYTLCINDGDEYINCKEEVRVNCNDGDRLTGLFECCDDEGIWVEVGTDEINKVYVLYGEIETIKAI